MPIDIGIDFEGLEKLAKPTLVPDGTYETVIEKVDDSPVKQTGRPQWRFSLKIVNRMEAELQNKMVFVYAQLPWIDPATQQWDYSFTFTLVDIVKGTGMQVVGTQIPDPEAFIGRGLIVVVGNQKRKGTESDADPIYDNTVKIVRKKGGGLVS